MHSTLYAPTVDEMRGMRAREEHLYRKQSRMTLIVGFVGSDGIVIAADQKMADFATGETEYDNFMHGRKLSYVERHRMLLAYCGDLHARRIGDEIIAGLDEPRNYNNVEGFLRNAGERGMRRVYEEALNPYAIRDLERTILVAFYGNEESSLRLYRLNIMSLHNSGNPAIQTAVELVTGSVIIGAKGNSARYFGHYFTQGMSTSSLTFLAAHIILSGNRVDGMIEGLDIATIRENNCRLLSDSEKNQLRTRSHTLDELIRQQLETR